MVWQAIEAEWQSKHLEQLQPLLRVTSRTHEFVAAVATHSDLVNATGSDVAVHRMFLRRIGEELRGVELLASAGHGFQAVSVASNLFEQSHAITHFGATADNARVFLEWAEIKATPLSVADVVKRSGGHRGWDKDRIDDEYYRTYRLLCAFKHNNPLIQRVLTLPVDPDLYLARFALSNSMWFTLSAVGMVAAQRLSAGSLSLLDVGNSLMGEVETLFPEFPISEAELAAGTL